MLGMQEIILLTIFGGIIFFFGKDKVKEWLSLGKEIKSGSKETTKA